MRASRFILPLALTVLAGCYRYTPIEAPTPSAGANVRLQLTDGGSVALAPWLGFRVESVDGRLLATEDTAYVVAVTATTNRIGTETQWSRERVAVPRSAVSRVHLRELDRGRSWVAAGITTAAILGGYLVFDLVRSGSGGKQDQSGGGGPK